MIILTALNTAEEFSRYRKREQPGNVTPTETVIVAIVTGIATGEITQVLVQEVTKGQAEMVSNEKALERPPQARKEKDRNQRLFNLIPSSLNTI